MINFTPEEIQKEIILRKQRKRIFLTFCLIFIAELSFSLVMLYFYYQTKANLGLAKAFKENLIAQENTKILKETKEEILKTNFLLKKIESFYQNRILLAKLLLEISKALPEGLKVSSLTYNSSAQMISLTGKAKTRELLLEFKRNLEKIPEFKEVNFPPLNWVKKENIKFLISLKINGNSKKQ